MENLFAYGSLMCDDIMLEVSGCGASCVNGILKGYCRRSVKGEYYPAIVPDVDGNVDGVVYLNVPDSAWERLDSFEGEMYSRELVRIAVNNEEIINAATYVLKPKFKDRLDQSEWSFSDFLRKGKTNFQKSYKGYQSL